MLHILLRCRTILIFRLASRESNPVFASAELEFRLVARNRIVSAYGLTWFPSGEEIGAKVVFPGEIGHSGIGGEFDITLPEGGLERELPFSGHFTYHAVSTLYDQGGVAPTVVGVHYPVSDLSGKLQGDSSVARFRLKNGYLTPVGIVHLNLGTIGGGYVEYHLASNRHTFKLLLIDAEFVDSFVATPVEVDHRAVVEHALLMGCGNHSYVVADLPVVGYQRDH